MKDGAPCSVGSCIWLKAVDIYLWIHWDLIWSHTVHLPITYLWVSLMHCKYLYLPVVYVYFKMCKWARVDGCVCVYVYKVNKQSVHSYGLCCYSSRCRLCCKGLHMVPKDWCIKTKSTPVFLYFHDITGTTIYLAFLLMEVINFCFRHIPPFTNSSNDTFLLNGWDCFYGFST